MILTGNQQPIDGIQPVNWLAGLNRGLVAWYTAVPGWGGGSRMVDLCRAGQRERYGVLTNMDPTTDWISREGVYSLDLDGSNDFVRVPTTPQLCPPRITVSATAYPTAGAGGGNQGIVSMSALTNDGWLLYRTGATNSEQLNFGIHSTTFAGATAAASFATLNRFYRAAGTYDGVNIRAYLTGAAPGSQAKTGDITASTTDLAIGNLYTTGQYFPGTIDDVRIYNRALSAAEIQLEYEHSLAGWPEELNRISEIYPLRSFDGRRDLLLTGCGA